MERVGLLQLGGQDVTIVGPDMEIGALAPEFTVQDNNWAVVNALELTKGKVRIIAALPSLDTGVCDTETRRFNQEAASLNEDIVIISVSADLPTTQKRWCGAAEVDRVIVLSDHLEMDFGKKYGCLIKERRLLRRAVFVVDREDKVVYAQYMPALGDQPIYEDVIAAAKLALG
ncbi:MAG: thiol peroxidase [Anaerolineae bacterium]|nr:thiol peroxidase [Anaerolineae bacterium]